MKKFLSFFSILCFAACGNKTPMPDQEGQLHVSVDNEAYRLILVKDLITDASAPYSYEKLLATEVFINAPVTKVYRARGNDDSSMVVGEFRAGKKVVRIGLDTGQAVDIMYFMIGGHEVYFKVRDLNDLDYLGYSKTGRQYFKATINQKSFVFSLQMKNKKFEMFEYDLYSDHKLT